MRHRGAEDSPPDKDQSDDQAAIPVFKGNPETERRHVERIQALRSTRDNALVMKRLDELAAAARAKDNLVERLVYSVKAYATIGEICDTLRGVYGVYEPSQVI